MGFGRSDKPPQPAPLRARAPRRQRGRADRRARPARGHAGGARLGRPDRARRAARAARAPARRWSLMNTWAWELPSFLPPFLREFRTEGLGEILALGGNLFVESIPGGMARRDIDPVMMDAYRAPFPDYWSRVGTLAFQRDIPLTERDRSAPLMAAHPRAAARARRARAARLGHARPRVPARLPRPVAGAASRDARVVELDDAGALPRRGPPGRGGRGALARASPRGLSPAPDCGAAARRPRCSPRCAGSTSTVQAVAEHHVQHDPAEAVAARSASSQRGLRPRPRAPRSPRGSAGRAGRRARAPRAPAARCGSRPAVTPAVGVRSGTAAMSSALSAGLLRERCRAGPARRRRSRPSSSSELGQALAAEDAVRGAGLDQPVGEEAGDRARGQRDGGLAEAGAERRCRSAATRRRCTGLVRLAGRPRSAPGARRWRR